MTDKHNLYSIFSFLPKPLVYNLEKRYTGLKRNFIEGRFEPSELNGAKFCEVVLRILQWYVSTGNNYIPFGTKINNFDQEMKKFESQSNFPDSIRFHVPNILRALYTIRNKRGVAHIGGDVDPNHMDASFVISSADWIMAELVRLFHNIDTLEAQKIVESLVTKNIPLIWSLNGKKRVLNPKLKFKETTLALLYSEYPNIVPEDILFEWVEHSNLSVFRRDILKFCHKERLLEYYPEKGEVIISPIGIKFVEDNIKLEVY